jgi:hypothetical protein
MRQLIKILLLITAVNASAAELSCRSTHVLTIDGSRGSVAIVHQTYTIDTAKGTIEGNYNTVDPEPWVLKNLKDITLIAADHGGTTVMVIKDDATFVLMVPGTQIEWGACQPS